MANILKREPKVEAEPRPVVMPAVNLYEREHEVIITADMPGVGEKDVDITVEKNVLTLTGQSSWQEPEGYERRYREFQRVEYRRVFSLTSDHDAENIQAVIKNGVLTVTVPKSEAAKPRKIAVQIA